MSMRCGLGCRGEVTPDGLGRQPLGVWKTVGIPLRCFSKAGADMARIDAVFELYTLGKLDISISKVELGTVANSQLSC